MAAHNTLATADAPRLDLIGRARRLFAYRELLLNLVRKELRVRYKESVLGFAWSMLNPVLYLVVFYLVFNIFLPGGIPLFPVFLLAGLLPWTLLSSSLSGGASAIVANAALLKKVSFPREVLPLASIGASLFHFFLQMCVLMAALVVFRYEFVSAYLLLVPVALVAEVLFLAGMVLLLSALTVQFRDIQHFLELALLAWFWMTPIVYPVALVAAKLGPKGLFGLYLMNPAAPVVLTFQRAFYNKVTPLMNGEPVNVLLAQPFSWYVQRLGYLTLAGIVLIFIGQLVFARLEGDFAAEL